MSIDWFTFAAQVVNFLILIWLLQRFLYGPVVRAMTERRNYIDEQFASAADAQTNAASKQREYEDRLQELAQTKETLITQARQEVEEWKAAQLSEAKTEVEDARQHWQQELHRDKQTLLQELKLDVTQHAVELSRHILQELTDQSLVPRLIERFINQLNDIDLNNMRSSTDGASNRRVTVVSSHELSDSDRSVLLKALEPLGQQIDFDINPRLLCGIELQSPECRLTWSCQEALAEVESELIDALEDRLPATPDGEIQHEQGHAEAATS